MVDEGFGSGDPRYRLAQLQKALLRDVRYVAGIKLHTEGWTQREFRDAFVAAGGLPIPLVREILFRE